MRLTKIIFIAVTLFYNFVAAGDSGRTSTIIFTVEDFWTAEALFRNIRGVIETRVGFTGGNFANPTYEDLKKGITDHKPAVEITYDGEKLSLKSLIDVYFDFMKRSVDENNMPLTGGIYLATANEEQTAKKYLLPEKEELIKCGITIQVNEAGEFWMADERHQRYFEKRGIITGQ